MWIRASAARKGFACCAASFLSVQYNSRCVDFLIRMLRRFQMRRCLGAGFVLTATLLSVQPQFAQGPGANPAMMKAKAENVPEIPFENVPDFLKLPPGVNFGESVGVATNSKGHTFV